VDPVDPDPDSDPQHCFCDICDYKKGKTTNFFPSSFVAVVVSGIRDGKKSGSEIGDEHPGSAALLYYANT
jgi:hypothetical protein